MELPISNRKSFQVSADDFGKNSRSNRNILYLIELGKIDRVAVMIDGEYSEKEIDDLSRSLVKLDVHLYCKEFSKNSYKKRSTVIRVLHFLREYISGNLKPKEVYNQWEQQIETFKKVFGKSPDGINSHEHIHFFPPYFKAILRLREKHEIPYIRFATKGILKYKNSVRFVINILRKIDLFFSKNMFFISSDFLVSLDWIKDVDEFRNNNIPEGITEVVCHPEIAEDFEKIRKNF